MDDQHDPSERGPREPDDTRPVIPSEPTHDETAPVGTRVLPPDPTLAGTEPPPQPRQRFGDRVWSLRAVIAVALASVILGGLGGAAIANAGDHADGRGGPGHGGFPHGGFHRGGPMAPPGSQRWQERRKRFLERRQGQGQKGPGTSNPSPNPSPRVSPPSS